MLKTIKNKMSQVFSDDGIIIPVTLLFVTEESIEELGTLKPKAKVKISGLTKGKGFQGVVKRWGFKGASKTHGTKHNERAPGSIGSSFPEKVFKGKKMAGRVGYHRQTIANLEIVSLDQKNQELVIKGAVPGKRGTRLEVRAA